MHRSAAGQCPAAAVFPQSKRRNRFVISGQMCYDPVRNERETIKGCTIDTGAIARRIVSLAEDKQAHDIVLLDIRSQSTIADYFVICSADNDRQLKAVVEHIDEQLRRSYGLKSRIEGSPETGWIILDAHDIVVHVFHQTQRDYYRLDQLWNRVPPLVVVQ